MIILVSNNKEMIQDMMSMFRRFLTRRKLELCAEKTKMLVFNRKGKKKRKFGDRKKNNRRNTDI